MAKYSYKLYKNNRDSNQKIIGKNNKYEKEELLLMTTYQLKEICRKEKLVKSITDPLDREELVHIIMRFRGEKDKKLVNKFEEDGFERIQDFLNNTEKIIMSTEDWKIKNPAQITIYEDLELNIFDNIAVGKDDFLEETNVVLISGENEVCTIMNVKKNKEGEFYLAKGAKVQGKESFNKNYSLLYFNKSESDIIHEIYRGERKLFPKYLKVYKFPIMDFQIKKVYDINIPLAIDFGSSNTTAGTFRNITLDNKEISESFLKNQLDFVEVLNIDSKNTEKTPLIPTVAAITSIKNNEIKYSFGYEAQKLSKQSFIDEGFCVFYDIKRWLSDIDRSEEVTDINGNRAFVKRKDIIKKYLEYIIQIGEQRFKCKFKKLHISCPVKQKYRFSRIIKELLPDYDLEIENMLDEGAAVLFNTISELIEKGNFVENEIYKALIIDCGGGTTDLSSCSFKIRNNKMSYRIHIETSYENGDVDFGGNNITFRIMQLIKILIGKNIIRDKGFNKNQILDDFQGDIFRYVDEYGIKKAYERLDKEYEIIESVIPTKFKEYENRSKKEYFKVKNNFYFLFQTAEKIKKAFYESSGLLQINLTYGEEVNNDYSETILLEKWSLSAYKDGELQTLKEIDPMYLSINDIDLLIKADIYGILSKFLENLYNEDKLLDYSIIKLTGQSCKIDIFKEAIKEYVPGKIIQFKKNKNRKKDSFDLKLACLKGALKYLNAKRLGYIDINIENTIESVPYYITAYTHNGYEENLISSLEIGKTSGHISRFMEEITLELFLKDKEENIRYVYRYENRPEDFEKVLFEDISEKFDRYIIQDETDNIIDNEVKFFIWAKPNEWGFYVVPILRQEEGLYLGRLEFFPFENDVWETNFFDGLK